MSRNERTGVRDLGYSKWHRAQPDALTMIDLDGVEYCRACREPVALIESVQGDGVGKVTDVLERLAARARLPAYLVAWKYDLNRAPYIVRWRSVYPAKGDWQPGATFVERLVRARCCHPIVAGALLAEPSR